MNIDDLGDAYFTNYKMGTPIDDVSQVAAVSGAYSINQDKLLTDEPDQPNNSNGTITLSGSYDQTLGKVLLNWTLTNMTSPNGFKIVQSTQLNPVYPGNEYHYLSDPSVRADNWTGLSAGTYHFRVCEYLGGACGIYSNDLVVIVP